MSYQEMFCQVSAMMNVPGAGRNEVWSLGEVSGLDLQVRNNLLG